MLSFSSRSKSGMVVGADGTLPYYNQPSATSASAQCYIPRNAGLSSHANMQGVLAKVSGPFTPYQWLELEHQALIYKYLLANVPVPATLLVPLRSSPSASGFPLSAGSFASGGWGSLHLGYSRNADLEPGRCRRTDGKKWRCSRNAVADQKYCERHMNWGHHRSRKHVEGQNCHTAKVMPIITSSQLTFAVHGCTSSTPTVSQQQSKTLWLNITDPHPVQLNDSVEINRMLNSKEIQDDYAQNPKSISMPSPVKQRSDSSLYPFSKPHTLLEGTSHGRAFGLNSNDSLFNTPSEVLPASLPEVEETLCDRTKHAVSIPNSGSDFLSSSFNYDKLALSPLKLSREYNLERVGLSVGVLNDVCQMQPNCRPFSWEASMAGPLGEVLKCTSCNPKDQGKNSSSLHPMADDFDSNTHQQVSCRKLHLLHCRVAQEVALWLTTTACFMRAQVACAMTSLVHSEMAEWKREGPIRMKAVDRPNGNSVDLANQELGTTALGIPVCLFVSCLCTIKLYASIIPNLFKFDDAFFEAFGLILV